MTNVIRGCKTVRELNTVVNKYFNEHSIRTKYSDQLRLSLKKQTDFTKAQQLVWNYILNQDFPTKSNDTKVVRHKGGAIGGMECHSYGHR